MIALTFLLMGCLGEEFTLPGDHPRTLRVAGVERSYIVHIPTGFLRGNPTPVVLCLHGAGMTGKMMANVSDLNKKADQSGFVVVYPNGTGLGQFLTWNAGGFTTGIGSRADDVAFIRQILDELSREIWLDKRRVFACGLSNGGMMCYRLASELSDRIAAIGVVAGVVALAECKPARPVAVLHFHGTADGVVSFLMTDKNMPPFMKLKSVQESIKIWVKLDGCQEEPVVDVLSKADDPLKVTRKRHPGGRDGTEVVLVEVAGGGHTWPGQVPALRLLGKSASVSANDLLWDFFQKHPMP